MIHPNSPVIQWYERDPARLVLERQAMQTRFPHLTLVKIEEENLAWFGVFKTNRGNGYELAIIYPSHFPSSPPNVFPINPQIWAVDAKGEKVKHQYDDGSLCLYYPNDRSFHPNTTAAAVAAVAAAWLFCYEEWLFSGKRVWPGPEAD